MKVTKQIVDKGKWDERTVWTNKFDFYHREDGPAIIYHRTGNEYWFLRGIWYETEKDYKNALYGNNIKKLNESK